MITEHEITAMARRLADALSASKVILFGSRAQGRAREDSDIDFLVVANTSLPPLDRFTTARRLLDDAPVSVDVFVKTPAEFEQSRRVVNQLSYYADRYGKVVYER